MLMKMAAEKHSSKSGGGYVGGLLQLFDWNTKSRKKLFSSKPSSEQSKRKKSCDGNFSRFHLMNEDDFMAGSSIRGGSDYSCASSMTDDDFGGPKAPSVVARLMGLDSMPTTNFPEPYATPYFGSSQSFQGVDSRSNGSARSVLEPRQAKAMNRPIEKFQTEMLPPKSAKSIPLSHHKLLSPIKRANYIPSENAAHIMEAAARIIGPGPSPPQTANAKVKLSAVGSSSAPLKVRDLKEKVEASQKPLKGKNSHKSWTSSADTVSSRVSSDSEECSGSVKSKNKCKGKSISLALQAKANVQKRGSLNSRSSEVQKESSEVTSNETFRSQASTHSSTQRKSLPPGVLRQNNQKQNCLVEKGKSQPKPSNTRKTSNADSSYTRSKSSSKNVANSKVASKRSKSDLNAGKREEASSNGYFTSKKRSIDGNFQSEKNHMKDEKLNASSSGLLMDRKSSIFEPSKRKGTDVISFTFTAPMKRSFGHSSETFREENEKNDLFSADFRGKRSLLNSGATNSTNFTLSGKNVIGGDALSALLEQKLSELTRGMESPSPPKAATSENSSSIFQDSSNKSSTPDYMIQDQNNADDIIEKYSPGFSSADFQGFIMKHKLQVNTDQSMVDSLGRNNMDVKKLLDYRLPSPVSVFEQSVFAESCNSSDTFDSFFTGGSKQSSSVQAQDVLGISSLRNPMPHPMEVETDLLDSASSLSFTKNANWELEYVKDILQNAELMFKDFAIGRTHKVINPLLFDHLESRKWELNSRHEPKLRRKVIFDCVAECMDIRCKHYASGGCKTWVKGLFAVTSKTRLAEEVYKEISGFKEMGDCMVDELVDKDMSSKNGAWLDFEIEAFELGIQIENRILNHLLDEIIADMLVL